MEWGIQGGWIYYGVCSCSCRRPQFLFFIQYCTVQYNCQTAFEQGRFAPHPPTYPQHPSQDFCVRYLSYRQLRLEFFFSPLTMLHICMHACICTASHGFLVLPCQKLPYIPEIKIVRKVKRYLPYLPVSMVRLSIGFPKEAKKVV